MKHSDSTLNILRLVAFAAVGIYLYKVYKKEGTLTGVSSNPKTFGVNTDKVLDSVLPWVNIREDHKDLLRNASREALNGYLRSKGVNVYGYDETE
jgi:hypothetical protein